MTQMNRLWWEREPDSSWSYTVGDKKVLGFKTEYSAIQAGLKHQRELEQWMKSNENSKT